MNHPIGPHLITLTTRHYLHRARALLVSAQHFLPEATCVAYVVDLFDAEAQAHSDPAKEPLQVIPAADLAVPRFRHLAFALDPTALCCLLKPYAVAHALRQGASQVIYLDNDILLYRRPDTLLAALQTHDLVLTPHLTEPPAPTAAPDESIVRPYGTFNAGLFALRASTAADQFLTWWAGRMSQPQDLTANLGYDQSWLNFVPGYWPGTLIFRDAGYNVGSWNLPSRPISHSATTGYLAGSAPLVAFHFSGFDSVHPEKVFLPYLPTNAPLSDALVRLARDYAALLETHGAAQCLAWGYGFATFSDGEKITATQRQYFANQLWHETPADADPFDPAFTTPGSRGVKSTYHYHRPAARATRVTKRLLGLAP